MRAAVRFGWIVLAGNLILACGNRAVDRRSILADDALSTFDRANDAEAGREVVSLTNQIEILLIENKYLFRLPVLEPRQDTIDAIKAFQKDKALPVTGRIDNAQLEMLENGMGNVWADVALAGNPFYLVSGSVGQRFASIMHGTWSSKLPTSGDKAGWPNVAEIECSEETASCVEAYATILSGSGPGVLMAHVNRWSIREWTGQIGAGRMLATDPDGTCPTLEVDWGAKTARTTTCPDPETGRQETSELVDGFRPYFDFIQAENQKKRAVWNSAYTRLLEQAIKGP